MDRRDIAKKALRAVHKRGKTPPSSSTAPTGTGTPAHADDTAPADDTAHTDGAPSPRARFTRPAPTGQQGGGVAGTLKGAASTAAANAATGALTGGVAGAARSVAVGAIRDHNSRKILTTLLVAIVAVIVLGLMLITTGINSVAAALLSEQENTNSRTSAEQAGISDDTIDQLDSTEHDDVPWPVQAAALDTNPDANLDALEAKLDDLDPPRDYRSFTVYATRSAHSATMIQQLEENPGKDYYATLKDYHLQAFEASGLTGGQANTAYDLATRISLGEDLCRAEGGGGIDPSGGFEYDGQTFGAGQVVNMKTVIGLAKTMAGSDWEAAARIGLITVAVESTFLNYANDGVVGPEDNNMGGFTESDYAKLAYSLTLPHDEVGTDHASVGIMQQQATLSWGAVGDSTFQTDPEGVIGRLMDPAFAGARFLQRVLEIDGWENASPGAIAQQVQVSSFPDRYDEQVPLADAILDEFGDQPGIDVPGTIGWNGPDNSGDTNGDGDTTQRCGEENPEGNLPTGNEQQLAQKILDYADEGRIVWYAPAAEGFDQIAAYAAGGPISEECTLDSRILQLLIMGAEMFNQMSINSLNRRCTGTTPGAGQASYHWKGQAADIGSLNGKSTTGNPAIPEAHQFWQRFAEVAVDSGGGLGQLECRGGQAYEGVANFADPCNHLHFEIGRGDNTTPLKG